MDAVPKKHLYGIDFARIVAILLVILQHLTVSGGLDGDGQSFPWRLGMRLVESMAQPCVDLFALISGYVCLNARWRPLRYFGLWLQVVFTSAVIVAAVSCVADGSMASEWAKVPLPVFNDTYWYFTGYTVVFLLMPLLNWLMKRPFAPFVAFGVVAVVSVLQAFGADGLLKVFNNGYSSAWLVLLYLVGAGLKSVDSKLPRSPLPYFALALCCLAGTMGQRLAVGYFEWTLFSFVSPTNTVAAAALLLGLLRLPEPRRFTGLVRALSGAAFGVYLWHVHPLFFTHFWRESFVFFKRVPGWACAPAVIATAVVIFMALAVLELLRIRLFARCLSKVNAHGIAQ